MAEKADTAPGQELPACRALPGLAAPFAGPCRYLISLDYDGTLRADEGPPVPPAFLALMARWRPQGLRWGINSGRSMTYLLGELLPALEQAGGCSGTLPDFLCTCERYVHLADEQGRLLPDEEHNARCLADNLALRVACLPAVQASMARLQCQHPEWAWEYAADDPLSIEAADTPTMDAMLPDMLRLAATLPGATVQRAGRYLRFSDARHHKGSALACVNRAWGVPAAHIAIIGDGQNDIDAFRHFPGAFCAAPAGAAPEVADYLGRHGGYLSPRRGVADALLHWAARVGLR